TRTAAPGSAFTLTPPTATTRRNPAGSARLTRKPTVSLCATTATCGAPSAGPKRALTFASASIVTLSASGTSRSARARAMASSWPEIPGIAVSSARVACQAAQSGDAVVKRRSIRIRLRFRNTKEIRAPGKRAKAHICGRACRLRQGAAELLVNAFDIEFGHDVDVWIAAAEAHVVEYGLAASQAPLK